MEITVENIAVVGAIFLLAGLIKGIVGLGLPTVSLALLTVTVGLKAGIALMLVPSFATNVWQAVVGGQGRALLARFWALLVAVVVGLWIGTGILARSDGVMLSAIFGGLLMLWSAYGLLAPKIPDTSPHERWLSPVIGGVTGFVTGLTGSFVIPGVLYLQSLGLDRDALVQTMGICFTISTVALALAMSGRGLLPSELGVLSFAGLPTAFAGMWIGQRVRQRLNEAMFRRVFFWALLALGAFLVAKAFR